MIAIRNNREIGKLRIGRMGNAYHRFRDDCASFVYFLLYKKTFGSNDERKGWEPQIPRRGANETRTIATRIETMLSVIRTTKLRVSNIDHEIPKRRNAEIFEESARFEQGILSLIRFRAFVISSFKRPPSCSAERNIKGERGARLLSANRARFRPAGGIYFSTTWKPVPRRVQSYQIAWLKSSNIFVFRADWVRSRCGARSCVKKIFSVFWPFSRNEKGPF
jgi:hypothetical protein